MSRMVRAELLKLHRNASARLGFAATVVGLPFGLLAMVAMASGSITVDGGEFAAKCVEVLLGPGLVGATLIGVAAGTADRTAGVLPVLVATGRPRAQLFAARVPAVLVATVVLSLALWVVVCALGFALHAPATRAAAEGARSLTGSEALDLLPRILAIDVVIGLGTLGLCTAGLSAAAAVGGVLAVAVGVMPMVAIAGRTPDWVLGLMPPLSTSELVGGETFVGPVTVPVGWALLGIAVWTVGMLAVGRARLLRADV